MTGKLIHNHIRLEVIGRLKCTSGTGDLRGLEHEEAQKLTSMRYLLLEQRLVHVVWFDSPVILISGSEISQMMIVSLIGIHIYAQVVI